MQESVCLGYKDVHDLPAFDATYELMRLPLVSCQCDWKIVLNDSFCCLSIMLRLFPNQLTRRFFNRNKNEQHKENLREDYCASDITGYKYMGCLLWFTLTSSNAHRNTACLYPLASPPKIDYVRLNQTDGIFETRAIKD